MPILQYTYPMKSIELTMFFSTNMRCILNLYAETFTMLYS